MRHVTIPQQWSGREALAIVGFLDRVIAAIWRAHGQAMALEMLDFDEPLVRQPKRSMSRPLSRKPLVPLRRADDRNPKDDDIPF